MEIDLHDLGIPLKIGIGSAIPEILIPKELITGYLRDSNGSTRCQLKYKETVNHGSYGYIQRVLRNDVPCVCKRPLRQGESFAQEAVTQAMAYRTLDAKGIRAVPKVLDIYRYVSETRFTMEYIEGRSALEEIYESTDPDTTLLQVLAQTCLLLGLLEEAIHLDHRDLKMTNLWIRKTPVNYRIALGSKMWDLKAPFQVVILDFGFACIGDGFGRSIVNLGDVIPDLDPCPKDGRDLYQCIMSLLSVEKVALRLSAGMQETLKGWVGPSGSLAVTYLITSHPRFSISALRPLSLLSTICGLGHIALNES